MRIDILTFIVCTVAVLADGQLLASAPPKAGEIKTEKRSFQMKSGETIHYEIGTLFVRENRSDPKSRLIGVGFARFPATVQQPTAPPMFQLPGGPGGSYLTQMKSSNRQAPRWHR